MRANLIDKYKDDVTSFSQSKGEPDWYQKVRLDSLEKAEELSLPKYEKINYRSWRLDRPGSIESADTSEFNRKPQAENYIYQVGDKTISTNLEDELSKKGVILTDIFSAMKDYPELMQKYFMTKVTKTTDNKLTALNAAFLNSGVFLYVPKGVRITKSIQAMFVQDNSIDCDFVHHVLIVADADTEVTYLENLVSEGSGYKNKANVVVEVIAADNSRVHFSALDQLSKDTTTYLNRRGITGNNARLDWAIGFMNDGNVIGDFGTDLLGEGSHTEAKVVAITTGEQVQGIDTKVTNYGKHTIGHILQHGVILQKSTLTFNGVGHIVKGARGSDAQQESRVLMLSRKARGDANPILLIDENDVTAGHAASVGRVNEDQMYYLMSRGIDEKTAQRLVIRGFLSSVISEIPEKDVRASLTQMIERKLVYGQQ
ncbi:Fe-S cluster assembly protein SufD [Companilactobacillus keshanensis]|uniref:Fe-S cluster assembly protein SufD n=1 Tax=Companilactobacillus keshanensis TaxID=2486003 RepID=A0ABW4BSS1_9LACO|nr:Fe-S cluster assembly protein SufD [Companilactobacillus keshanensis]